MQELTDIEILERVVGGVIIKEMSAITFLGWCAQKLNGVTDTRNPAFMELRTAVASPPLAGRLADETKIRYVRNLLALGITI